MGEVKEDLGTPILRLRAKFWEANSGHVCLEFGFAAADYLRKSQHLGLICSRIERTMAAMKKETDNWAKYGGLPRTDYFESLSLDYEDFYVHSRMLLDKIAFIASLLFRDEASLPYRSFNAHRSFFFKPRNNPWSVDEKYAKHIREKTDWFERDLKNPRDDLLVHSKGKRESIHSEGNTVQVERMGLAGRYRKQIAEICRKYRIRLSSLREGTEVVQALQILENNKAFLQKKDIKTLVTIRQHVGGALPDIGAVLDNIVAFLGFFEEHFSQKICQAR